MEFNSAFKGLKPWRQDLLCFGILHIVEWLFLTDVSGQSIGPIFRGRRSRPLQTGPIGCLETPIRNYRYTARKIAKESRSHLHRGGTLKSRNSGDIGNLLKR